MLGVVTRALVFEPGEMAETVAKATHDQIVPPVSVKVGDRRMSRPRQPAEQPFGLGSAIGERNVPNLAGEFVGRKRPTDEGHEQIRPLKGKAYGSAVHCD